MTCDLIQCERARRELLGGLAHAQVAKNGHRRAAHQVSEPLREGRTTQGCTLRQTLKRMMPPGLRGHLRERTGDLRISQHRESLDPGLHRANGAAQQHDDYLLEQRSAHRTRADFLRDELRQRRFELAIELVARVESFDDR